MTLIAQTIKTIFSMFVLINVNFFPSLDNIYPTIRRVLIHSITFTGNQHKIFTKTLHDHRIRENIYRNLHKFPFLYSRAGVPGFAGRRGLEGLAGLPGDAGVNGQRGRTGSSINGQFGNDGEPGPVGPMGVVIFIISIVYHSIFNNNTSICRGIFSTKKVLFLKFFLPR